MGVNWDLDKAFGIDTTSAPFVSLVIKYGDGAKLNLNDPPNTKLTKFDMNWEKGNYGGSFSLYETFGQGQETHESMLDTIAVITNQLGEKQVGLGPKLLVQFGWKGSVSSPTYECAIMKIDYHMQTDGNVVTITFMSLGYETQFSSAKMPEDPPKEGTETSSATEKPPGIKGFPTELISQVVDIYNQSKKWKKIDKIVYYPNGKGSDTMEAMLSSPSIVTPVDNFPIQGKYFKDVISEILTSQISPVDVEKGPLAGVSFSWWTETVNGVHHLVVWGETSKGISAIKKRYNYRGGVKSDVLSFSYSDNGNFGAYMSGLAKNNFKIYKIDRSSESMEEIRVNTADAMIKRAEETKGVNADVDTTESTKEDCSNYVTVDASDSNYLTADAAGRAILRKVISDFTNRYVIHAQLELVGDPTYAFGIANMDKPEYVSLTERVNLIVYNANGKVNAYLGGNFIIVGFGHAINGGLYKTTVKLIKTPTG